MIRTGLWIPLLLAGLCAACGEAPRSGAPEVVEVDAISEDAPALVFALSGEPLRPPALLPNQAKLEADLAQALGEAEARPDDPDALIWVGRRLGYLWRYHEAIAVFGRGIERWPDDPRFYRHRGHRYITVREFARAQTDLQRAAGLIAGRPDEVEPDGAPNPAGIPRTTLAYNIWYHLGLAHFLQGGFEPALAAYEEALKVSDNDDALVAATDWAWMSLMRLDRRDDAARLLQRIEPQMEILENDSYHRRLLMYQGLAAPESLLELDADDAVAVATQGYGVGHYHLVHGDTAQAIDVFETVLAGSGWNAFGYIAAEAELSRLR